jgi:hypothetical protein
VHLVKSTNRDKDCRVCMCYKRAVVTFLFFIIIISGVGLSRLGTAATSGLLYKPNMIDEGNRGAIGGMKIGRGNRSTRRKHSLKLIQEKETTKIDA